MREPRNSRLIRSSKLEYQTASTINAKMTDESTPMETDENINGVASLPNGKQSADVVMAEMTLPDDETAKKPRKPVSLYEKRPCPLIYFTTAI